MDEDEIAAAQQVTTQRREPGTAQTSGEVFHEVA
jgi:hypothetical protein